ncbi:hypothetical protein G7Z17_g13361 [Cylindrodendrum hubeiense]|uniref:Uncharacterized protein n=1 Tax=Cylindrodendrum hubeiense TaxID=595255 RepID=A0A9P5GVZ7_9HYPO|nr:hypothetical protein G7Z17_g13361 [Cylindrodendrum hubeiense]
MQLGGDNSRQAASRFPNQQNIERLLSRPSASSANSANLNPSLSWTGLDFIRSFATSPIASTTDKWLSPPLPNVDCFPHLISSPSFNPPISKSPIPSLLLHFASPCVVLHSSSPAPLELRHPQELQKLQEPHHWNIWHRCNRFENQQPATRSVRDTHSRARQGPGRTTEPLNHHAAYASRVKPRNTRARRLRRPVSTRYSALPPVRIQVHGQGYVHIRVDSDGDPAAAASLAAPSCLTKDPRLRILCQLSCSRFTPVWSVAYAPAPFRPRPPVSKVQFSVQYSVQYLPTQGPVAKRQHDAALHNSPSKSRPKQLILEPAFAQAQAAAHRGAYH